MNLLCVLLSVLFVLLGSRGGWAQYKPPPPGGTGGSGDVVFQADCSTITAINRCCWDTDDFLYYCGNGTAAVEVAPAGDAFTTASNGTTSASATGAGTLQFPSTTTISGANPVVVAIPEARLFFGFSCNDTTATPEYLYATSSEVNSTCPGTDTSASTNTRHMATSPLRLQRLHCFGLPDTGDTWTLTVRVNGVNTALTCAMTQPATTCNDTTHTATATAGQGIAIEHTDSDAAFDGANIRCGVEGVITP